MLAESEKKVSSRLSSLDAFRGLTIAVMILVDDAGVTFNHILDHSPWDGITLADFVMPFFLFIVGAAIPLAFKKYTSTCDQADTMTKKKQLVMKVLTRSIKLFFLGIILQGAKKFPTEYDLSTLRIGGILQRIAFVYLVLGLCEVQFARSTVHSSQSHPSSSEDKESMKYRVRVFLSIIRSRWVHWAVCIGFLLLYFLLIVATNVDHECGYAKFDIKCNAVRYWDKIVLGYDRMYKHPTYRRSVDCSSCSPGSCPLPDAPSWCSWHFDPEGMTGAFCALFSGMIGLHFGYVSIAISANQIEEEPITNSNGFLQPLMESDNDLKQPIDFESKLSKSMFYIPPLARARLWQWIPFAAILLILGIIFHFTCMPLNKNLYSISYMLFMGGASGLCLSLLFLIIDVWNLPKIITYVYKPLIWMGCNAILIFILAACAMFTRVISWFYWENKENNLISHFNHLFTHSMGYDKGQLIYVLMWIVFWFVVSWFMYYKKWFIKI